MRFLPRIGLLFAALTALLVPAVSTAPPAAAAVVRNICFPVVEPVTYTETFGAPRDGHFHEGEDLMGQKMYHLLAVEDATIVDLRGPGGPDGNAYSIRLRDDDGWYFAYLHINNDTPGTDDGLGGWDTAFAPGLQVGQRVKRGQFLAYMGDSGNAENAGAHLHFEIRQPAPTVWQSVAVSGYDSLRAAPACVGPFGDRPATWLGGRATSDPDVGSWGADRLDIAVRGTDNGVWWQAWNGLGFTGWSSLSGVLKGGPAVADPQPGRSEVFGRGTDNALWHRSFANGAWGPWESLGGILTSDPDAAAIDGTVDVVVRGTDAGLWHRILTNGTWGPWSPLGVPVTGGPAIVASPGRVDLFARSASNSVLHRSLTAATGTWSDWEDLGGILTSDPDASAMGDRVDLVGRGADNGLWRRSLTGTTWTPWAVFGAGPAGSGPSSVAWNASRTDAVVEAADGSIWQSWWPGGF